MNSFELFQTYLALKNHFNKKTYYFHKYNGKVKATYASFEKRHDKYFFEKLAKKEDPFHYLLANFLTNNSFWIGDLLSSDVGDNNYTEWKKRTQSFSYTLEQDVAKIVKECASIKKLIEVPQNSYPILLEMYMNKTICIESLVVIVDCLSCISYWNKELKNDLIWENVGMLIIKYKPFLTYDKQKYRKVIKKYLTIK